MKREDSGDETFSSQMQNFVHNGNMQYLLLLLDCRKLKGALNSHELSILVWVEKETRLQLKDVSWMEMLYKVISISTAKKWFGRCCFQGCFYTAFTPRDT